MADPRVKGLVYDALASVLGSPVDLFATALRPMGYSAQPILGSQFIRSRLPQTPQGQEPPRRGGSDIPQLDEFGRIVRDEPMPERQFSPLERFAGGVETAEALTRGVASLPVAGVGGLAQMLRERSTSPAAFERGASPILEAMGYQPKTEAGQEYLRRAGGALERLETEYKIPPIGGAPSAAPLLGVRGVGTQLQNMSLQRAINEHVSRNEPLRVFEPGADQSAASSVLGGQRGQALPSAGDVPGQTVQYVQLPDGRFATSTALTEAKRIPVGFERAATPEEAAHITAGLRKSPQEQLVALVVDENDKPIQIIRHTIGKVNEAPAEYFSLLGSIANTPGAKSFWIAHNHPSGTAALSGADKTVANHLQLMTANTGLENRGILAIGKDSFGFYDPKSKDEIFRASIPPARRDKNLSMVERTFRRTGTLSSSAITSFDQAVNAAKTIAGDTKGLMLMDNSNNVVGFVPLENVNLRQLRETGGAKQLFGALERANANNTIVVAKDGMSATEIVNLHNFLNQSGVRLLDALVGERFESQAAKDRMPIGAGTAYRAALPVGIGLGAAAMGGEAVE